MTAFKWTKNKEKAALALAEGRTQKEAADTARVTDRTIRRWLDVPEFAEEVDRLTFMVGIASKAERLRLAMRVVRRLREHTEKDLLDWLKYVQGETDGVKLDIADILTALSQDGDEVAGR